MKPRFPFLLSLPIERVFLKETPNKVESSFKIEIPILILQFIPCHNVFPLLKEVFLQIIFSKTFAFNFFIINYDFINFKTHLNIRGN